MAIFLKFSLTVLAVILLTTFNVANGFPQIATLNSTDIQGVNATETDLPGLEPNGTVSNAIVPTEAGNVPINQAVNNETQINSEPTPVLAAEPTLSPNVSTPTASSTIPPIPDSSIKQASLNFLLVTMPIVFCLVK